MNKALKDKKNIAIIILVFTVVVLGLALKGALEKPDKDWMLSLYHGGATVMRLDYISLESCREAGGVYLRDGTAEKFDCGLNCEDSTDLNQRILCEKVCDTIGCKQ